MSAERGKGRGKLDVPQFSNLSLLRRILSRLDEAPKCTKEQIAQSLNVGSRTVDYGIKAAVHLGFLTIDELTLTPTALELLRSEPESPQSAAVWRAAIETSQVFGLAKDLFDPAGPELDELVIRIMGAASFKKSTAERRAKDLLGWRRRVLAWQQAGQQRDLFPQAQAPRIQQRELQKGELLIITIRQDEFEAVQHRLVDHQVVRAKRHSYLSGIIDTVAGERVPVNVARCHEQGNLDALAITRDAIDDLSPSFILVVGIAGAVPTKDVTLGDVVVSTRIYDLRVRALREGKDPEFATGGGPLHPDARRVVESLPIFSTVLSGWNRASILKSPRPSLELDNLQLCDDSEHAGKVRESLEFHFRAAGGRQPRYFTAPIVSSDDLVKDPEQVRLWKRGARNFAAIEMEAAGVYRAADGRIPVLAIRGISDVVGLSRDDAWTEYACQTAASFVIAAIRSEALLTRPAIDEAPAPPIERLTIDELFESTRRLFEAAGNQVTPSSQQSYALDATQEQGLFRQTISIRVSVSNSPVNARQVERELTPALSSAADKRLLVCAPSYTDEALAAADRRGVRLATLGQLESGLINFAPYIASVRGEALRPILLNEYQQTDVFDEENPSDRDPAPVFLERWLRSSDVWLTVLGDYGVGKSWMLKHLLYTLVERFAESPNLHRMPFFVPLQKFRKAFTFDNLISMNLRQYGLANVSYDAFRYLMSKGRVVFLLDSFDEMAQSLNRRVIRENLDALIHGIHESGNGCKAIMTSRPTYFESKAERLLTIDKHGSENFIATDHARVRSQAALARKIGDRLKRSRFARLTDLTDKQRRDLFAEALKNKPEALKTLLAFHNNPSIPSLRDLTKRAVIARLLVAVAESLSEGMSTHLPDGSEVPAARPGNLNSAGIMALIVNSLLKRDSQIGDLSNGDRQLFLRQFAVYLEAPSRDIFASPRELRALVKSLFSNRLQAREDREQALENYYRTCRRHSGLTTEKQYQDTSGMIDIPVGEADQDSRVGFSHNSLREFLVADAFAASLNEGRDFAGLSEVRVSDAVGEFFSGLAAHDNRLVVSIRRQLAEGTRRDRAFRLAMHLVRDGIVDLTIFGTPANLSLLELGGLDLSKSPLRSAAFDNSLLDDTDLRESDLRGCTFSGAVLNGTLLTGSRLDKADFRGADIESIYVYDQFTTKTLGMLKGHQARQWLYSSGAHVDDDSSLNKLLGRPWYEAAREVCVTFQQRMAGSIHEDSVVRGTDLQQRRFAAEFRDYLVKRNLVKKRKSKRDGSVLTVARAGRDVINAFANHGEIREVLQPFFDKHVQAADRS